jgi:RimJ/RimL family protein N-acetyltransferase
MTGTPSDSHEFTGDDPVEIRVSDDLALRQLTLADSEAYFDLINGNRQHLSMFGDDTSEKYPTLESVQVRNADQRPSEYRFGIWHNEDDLVGFVKLTEVSPVSTEIGYWLGEAYQGKGMMTQSVVATRDYAIQVLGYEEVIAWVEENNEKSQAVLTKIDFAQQDSQYDRIRTSVTEAFVDRLFSYAR